MVYHDSNYRLESLILTNNNIESISFISDDPKSTEQFIKLKSLTLNDNKVKEVGFIYAYFFIHTSDNFTFRAQPSTGETQERHK